jgi:hypothetical protein
MRPFRRNSSLKGSEATEIIRHRPQRQLKDSLDGPQWKASIRWRSRSAGSAMTAPLVFTESPSQ